MHNQRNLILAVGLSLVLLLGFDFVMSWFYPQPAPTQVVTTQADTPAQRAAARHTREGGLTDPASGPWRQSSS